MFDSRSPGNGKTESSGKPRVNGDGRASNVRNQEAIPTLIKFADTSVFCDDQLVFSLYFAAIPAAPDRINSTHTSPPARPCYYNPSYGA